MSVTYESAHKRYRDAREEYHQLEAALAIVRAKMNAAERECSAEWRKLLDASMNAASLTPAMPVTMIVVGVAGKVSGGKMGGVK